MVSSCGTSSETGTVDADEYCVCLFDARSLSRQQHLALKRNRGRISCNGPSSSCDNENGQVVRQPSPHALHHRLTSSGFLSFLLSTLPSSARQKCDLCSTESEPCFIMIDDLEPALAVQAHERGKRHRACVLPALSLSLAFLPRPRTDRTYPVSSTAPRQSFEGDQQGCDGGGVRRASERISKAQAGAAGEGGQSSILPNVGLAQTRSMTHSSRPFAFSASKGAVEVFIQAQILVFFCTGRNGATLEAADEGKLGRAGLLYSGERGVGRRTGRNERRGRRRRDLPRGSRV